LGQALTRDKPNKTKTPLSRIQQGLTAFLRVYHQSYLSFRGGRSGALPEIKGDPIESIEALIRMFFRNCDDSQKSVLKSIILRILIARDLPTFDTLLAQEFAPEVEFFEDDDSSF